MAVIPARGGSKSIPRKNLALLAGKPLVSFAIEAALGAPDVNRVVVTTDDLEIAAAAREHGAEVIDRPPGLATDTASSESALLHALERLDQEQGYRPARLVFLQCTSPLTLPADVAGTLRVLAEERSDSALAVAPFHSFLWRRDSSGAAVGANHDSAIRLRRQERVGDFVETGAVYAMDAAGFRRAKHRFFGKIGLYEMPPDRVLEIDEPIDLEIAQARLSALCRRRNRDLLPAKVTALIMDFDGVFTDDRVLVDQDGREAVVCSRSDGMGIEALREAGIPMLVLSKEANAVVGARCAKLGIPYQQDVRDKYRHVHDWLAKNGLAPAAAVYIGNDVNDVECLRAVGCGVVPANAHPGAKAVADIVLRSAGGAGALRELSDMILGAGGARPC